MNYDFFYNIKNYSCDDEYQKEFLNVFKITDIMDPELSITLDKIFNHVKDIEEWKLLLQNYCDDFTNSVTEIKIDMGIPIGYSYTYLKDTHKAFVEYYNYNSLEHVKHLNDKFKSKLK